MACPRTRSPRSRRPRTATSGSAASAGSRASTASRFVLFDKSTTPALRNSGVHALLAGSKRRPLGRHQRRRPHPAEGRDGADLRRRRRPGGGRRARRCSRTARAGSGRARTAGCRCSKASASAPGTPPRASRATWCARSARTRQGALWIGTNGDGLFRMQDGAIHALHAQGRPAQRPRLLPRLRQGRRALGRDQRRRPGPLRGRASSASTDKDDGLDGDIIWSLLQDTDGSLWVGTYGAGLFRREGERFRGLTTRTGLSSDFVRALWQDHEGSLWIGTNTGGLAAPARRQVHDLHRRARACPTTSPRRCSRTRSGALWVGTSGGGLARFKDGAFQTWSRRDGLAPRLRPGPPRATGTGGLWVGTNGGGVARFADGRFRTYTTRDGLVDDHVSALVEDREGARLDRDQRGRAVALQGRPSSRPSRARTAWAPTS